MRFTSAIFLVAVIAAFVVMITATGERSEERSEEARASGCKADACKSYCKSLGSGGGYCDQGTWCVCN
ncbi:uncharacterized protein LOC142564741 [Dermacentor variabilis]|uniref:Defensin-like protein n=1 Tax=Dermacentor variabilis TaxID=34621 RepID=Q6YC89_DERVA|nr:defensin-like protein [Dermacentor variabilis]